MLEFPRPCKLCKVEDIWPWDDTYHAYFCPPCLARWKQMRADWAREEQEFSEWCDRWYKRTGKPLIFASVAARDSYKAKGRWRNRR